MSKKYLLILLLLLLSITFSSCNSLMDSTEISEEKDMNGVSFVEEKKESVLYSLAILADSHTSFDNLEKALNMSKDLKVDKLIHVGDFSNLGGKESLEESKNLLDKSGLDYLVIPGDRDLYNNSEDKTQEEATLFYDIFEGEVCKDQLLSTYKILCITNPYNYNLLSEEYISQLNNQISKADIIISSQPFYNPTNTSYMGFFDEDVNKQRDQILKTIRNSDGNVVVSGDAHFFSHYSDARDESLSYYTLGAITTEKNIQQPNFAVLYIYEDGITEVEQIVLE